MPVILAYEKRAPAEKLNALRRHGRIPAVCYGRKQAAIPLSVSGADFLKVWRSAGENAVVVLAGSEGDIETLIHTVDRHPVSGAFWHIDFYAFEKGQKLKVKIPIEFVGTAPAVKDLGGVLVKVMHEVEIEAAPKDLPKIVEVDLSPLVSFGKVVTAKEVKLPHGVTLVSSPDEIVASVYEPKEEIVEAPAPDLASIEVVKKGKEAAAPEEGTAAAPASGSGEKDKKAGEKGEKGDRGEKKEQKS